MISEWNLRQQKYHLVLGGSLRAKGSLQAHKLRRPELGTSSHAEPAATLLCRFLDADPSSGERP
jgi:hypothetical protein